MKKLLTSVILSISILYATARDQPVMVTTPKGVVKGSLLVPEGKKKMPVVLIIAGSGPTDRNGNQAGLVNNGYKMLAGFLQAHGIASLRYDKNGVGESVDSNLKMEQFRIDDYISTAQAWINMLSADKRFSDIILAGHSEGSLIGMIASENNRHVHGYISIAGAGRPAATLIREQLKNQPQQIRDMIYTRLDTLERGDSVRDVPPVVLSLLHPKLQPYLKSWFRYDPKKEIAKLDIPVLIIQGEMDMQVTIPDAQLLKEGKPDAELALIPKMCHVGKDVATMDKGAQLEVYKNPDLPLDSAYTATIAAFIHKHYR